jgi:hypothetical protein
VNAVDLLRAVTAASGGKLFRATSGSDLPALFKKALGECRSRYVLAYTPEGVRRDDGWHRLEVKLRNGKKGQVTARAGYLAR